MKITKRQIKREGGFILVTVLLMVVALSLIGITGMVISSNEVMIAGYINKSKEAFYVSEAALEEAKYIILNDHTKGKSTAVGVGSLDDTSQNWVVDEFDGFTMIDIGGSEFPITSNSATSLTLNSANTPLEGNYYIVYSFKDRGVAGVGGVGGAGTFTVATASWSMAAGDDWGGCVLEDSTATQYYINSTTSPTELNVSGTPALGPGSWEIICNRGVAATSSMTISDPTNYILPAKINADPWGWILIDSGGAKYNIEDGMGGFIGNQIVVTSGTPASGDFVVSRPSWIHEMNSPLYGGVTGTVGSMGRTYTIGAGSGSATVTLTKNGTTKGSYTMVSVGNIAKAKKAIQMTLTDSGNGDTFFKDWHEITPP